MPLSIGVNLRVTGHCNQGGRKYMEDMFSVAFQPTADDKDLEYAFFGIFDGHGGGEAATFAKEHLMDIIVKQKNFWSDRDEDVLRAIKDGYVNTHYAMWRELEKWPRTASGLPSTAGTTATIAFIRKGKIYIGHVGDSGVALGYQVDGEPQWKAKALTKDHKPESGAEMMRIQQSGGKVVSKSGVPRVVWNRPRIGHKGPVRRSTHIDEIPFLAVARSLGDLWSYNSELDTFVVSPEPDVKVVSIDVKSHKCLIFGTDGLWNMLTPHAAVAIVQAADRHNEKQFIASQQACNGQADEQMWVNPSKSLVDRALERWSTTRLRADNTSAVTLMLDPPGPSRSEVLLNQKEGIMMSNRHLTPSPLVIAMPTVENLEPSIPPAALPRPPSPGTEALSVLVDTPPEGLKPLATFRYEQDKLVACTLPGSGNITSRTSFEGIEEYPPPLDSLLIPMEDGMPSQTIEEHISLPVPMEPPLGHYQTSIETSPVASTSADCMERSAEPPQTFLVLPEVTDSSFSDPAEKGIESNNSQPRSISPVLVPIDQILDPYLYYASVEEPRRPTTIVNPPSSEKPDSSDQLTPTAEPIDTDDPICDTSQEELRKSIQVAEISSSVLPQAPPAVTVAKEVELITFDKTVLRTTKKQRAANLTRDLYESERVRLCVRKLPQTSPEKMPHDSKKFDSPSKADPLARPNILKKNPDLLRKSGTSEKEVHQDDINVNLRKQSSLLTTFSNEIAIIRRRRVASHSQHNSIGSGGSSENINNVVSMNLRLKSRKTKVPPEESMSEEMSGNKTNNTKTSSNSGAVAKRKHSAIAQPGDNSLNSPCTILEPCSKRRTRSEDRTSPTDENDPANQTLEDPKSRLGWTSSDSLGPRAAGNSTNNVQDRRSSPNNFQRRSLGKKASPVKAIRRPSLNGSNRLQQLRGSFSLRDWDQSRNSPARHTSERRLSGTVIGASRENSAGSQRWLRSDTLAATPVKTLRSRNVDINGQTIPSPLIHQYGVVKQNRLSMGGNLKQATSSNNGLQPMGTRIRSSSISPGKFKQANSSSAATGLTCASISPTSATCSSNSAIVKRVKSPYNPGSRTLATRSRMKILPYGK